MTFKHTINHKQYGAIENSSTTHALLDLLHNCFQQLDTPGMYARILLLDYSQAFDLVNHHLVLQKMKDSGAPDVVVRWCAAFLFGRAQSVKIGQNISAPLTLNGGTPQGTLLGPKAFIIHNNTFTPPGEVNMVMYVDDTSICHTSRDVNDDTIQQCANYASEWATENDMRLNIAKTKELVIDFGKTKRVLSPITISGQAIERVPSTKLLGVILSEDLKWTAHVDNLISRVNKRIFVVWHLKRSGVSATDLVDIYTSTIRPVLEYACPVWHTGLPDFLHRNLENIQKRVLRIIFGYFTPYPELLDKSCLPTLRDRREVLCKNFYTDMKDPSHKLHHLLPETRELTYGLRRTRLRPLLKTKTERFKNSFLPYVVANFD